MVLLRVADDDWEPDMVYWGPEVEMLASDRREQRWQITQTISCRSYGLNLC